MMRSYLTILIIILATAACSDTDKIPADVIPKQKMETILWQLLQTDEFLNSYVLKDSATNADKERMQHYNEIMRLNKTTQQEFKKSYDYYMAHPSVSKAMFDSISARGNRQRTEGFKPKNKPVIAN
jgi:hypothetical protein